MEKICRRLLTVAEAAAQLPMTVCVAAIAAKSKAIVMIADKAITYGAERPMQADVGIKKILPIGETGWHALIGGDPSFAQEVIDVAVGHITNEHHQENAVIPNTARAMMHCMKLAYKSVRKQFVSDKILSPRLLDENKLEKLPEDYVIEIYALLANYPITCSLLVCGFDSRGTPHIFSVTSPGIATNHDIPGFHAVGVGRDIAIGELYQFETKSTESLDTALYEVFDAKANAELIQGVGYEWDCSVLVADREPIEITRAARKAVEAMFEEATASPYHPKWGVAFNKIPKWKQDLKGFTDSVFKPNPKSTSRRSKLQPKKAAMPKKTRGQS